MSNECSIFRVECDYETALTVQLNRMVNFGMERRTIKRAPLNREAFRLKLKQDMMSSNKPSINGNYPLKDFDVSRFHFYNSTQPVIVNRRPTVSLQERLNIRDVVIEATKNEVPEFIPFGTIDVAVIGSMDNHAPNYGSIQFENSDEEDLPPLENSDEDVPTHGSLPPLEDSDDYIPKHESIQPEDLPPFEDDMPDLIALPITNGQKGDQQTDETLEILNRIFDSDESDNDLFIDADNATDDYDEPEITYKGYSNQYWNYGIRSEIRPVAMVIGRKS